MIDRDIAALVRYGRDRGLVAPEDEYYVRNRLLEVLQYPGWEACEPAEGTLEEILNRLTDYAVQRNICADGITARDLFDTRLMGALTPPPSVVRRRFCELYDRHPREATDWFYCFSQDTDYIRRYRVCRDQRWVTATPYGDLDITINLSKPEKDPAAVAAARYAPQVGYPKCHLCPENEGYMGRIDHPARQNHRIIPITLGGEEWFFQYSPYVYYNEHSIAFSGKHTPMVIKKATFRKLLDFVKLFPHYFIGSNADLPVVGGSILSHEHFQGGNHRFAMAQAEVELPVHFPGFEDVEGGILRWPMSVIRLRGANDNRLVELGGKILECWRNYSDPDAFIFAETDGVKHSTITPIARFRDGAFELDLVLRNNITTAEHPMGVYHPHAELHHIKRENIGLIEVMGLAVLPPRLKNELELLGEVLVTDGDIGAHHELEKHAHWAAELRQKYDFTPDNVQPILQQEVGIAFARVLEHAGVYKTTQQGRAAFLRFLQSVQ